jgi:hyaluronate lyase
MVVRVVSLVGVLLAASSAFADEYDTLRVRWQNILTGGSALDITDSDISNSVVSLNSSAQTYWNSLNTNAGRTYLWSDIARMPSNSADITSSYNRLRTMSLAFATRGGSLQNNANLLAATTNALDWMYANFYNPSVVTEYYNWWDWEIGTPLALNDITAALYTNLTPAQVTNYMNAVNRFTPTPTLTAANLVWKSIVVAVRGVIVKDSAKIASARDALSNVFPYVTSSDGFYTDGSFIQHTFHPYAGGYGSSLLGSLFPLMSLLNGSTWQVTDTNQQNAIQWIYDSFEPPIYKGAMMDMLSGRGISRQGATDHTTGAGIITGIIGALPFAPAADAARIKSMVKYWIQTDTARNFVRYAPLTTIPIAKDILADTNVISRGELIGHYNFARMDRVVHLRPDFGIGIATHSSRIANYESINQENLHGWHTGDGMTYLYNADLAQFSSNFWATVNPYRIPGTTVDTITRADSSFQSCRSKTNWVGGAALDLYGTVGMQLVATGSTLVAKKSWFCLDNKIVCLGADITCGSNHVVETIVENRRLNRAGTNTFLVNGVAQSTSLVWSATITNVTTAHLAGNVTGSDIAYHFPQPVTLRALRESRTNTWMDVNLRNTNTNSLTNAFVTVWFDHGTNPVAATYAYVLLPNFTTNQLAAYAAAPEVVILENSARAQGITQSNLNLTAVNFWAGGTNSLGGITVDRRASVIFQQVGSNLTVAVADPTQANTSNIMVEIDQSVSAILTNDAAISVLQLSPTLLFRANVSNAVGRSLRAIFATATDSQLGVSACAASSEQTGNVATNTLDNNLSTRWSANGDGEWIRYDLGATQRVDAVNIAFYLGDQRITWFDLHTSLDNSVWTTHSTSNASSGISLGFQRFNIPVTWARYVRIVGHGNSQNTWNSLTEVQVLGFSNAPPIAATVTTNTDEALAITITPIATDPDNGPVAITLQTVATPAHGTATIVAGAIQYAPTTGYTGPDTFNYIVTDGGLPGTGTVNVTIQNVRTFTGYQNQKFTPAQLADPNISGAFATPAGDGIANFMKYAINLDPFTPSRPPAGSVSNNYLSLTYTKRKLATDLRYIVELTSSLAAGWPVTNVTQTILTDDGIFQTIRASDPDPINLHTQRFIRIHVIKP